MKNVWTFLIGLFLGTIALNLSAQGPNVIVGGGGNREVVIMVDGKSYIRVTRDGQINLENGATLNVNGSTSVPGQFTAEAVTGGFPSAAQYETLLKLNAADANVLALQNTNTAGYSAFTSRGSDGREYMAMGYGNSTAHAHFAGKNYIESWSGTTSAANPPTFMITSDGNFGAFGSGFRYYKRFTIEPGGVMNFWKQIPHTMTQSPILKLEGKDTSSNEGFVKIFQDNTSNTIEVWKDDTPTRAFAIGLNKPEAGVLENDLILSTYNGSAWTENCRFFSGGFKLSCGTSTDNGGFTWSQPDAAIDVKGTSGNSGVRIDATGTPYTQYSINGTLKANLVAASTTFTIMGASAPNTVNLILGNNGAQVRFGNSVTPANTGQRYLCITTTGQVVSSATACSGT